MTEYNKKIEELLSKVSKGEKVFEPPAQPEPQPKANPLHEKIAKDGVKKTLEHIFNESFEVPSYITEQEDDLKVVDSSFIFVNVPSSFAQVDEYWNSLLPYFMRIGNPKNNGSKGFIDTELDKDKTLRIRVVRDENNAEKPSIAFGYLNGPAMAALELSNIISKVGLKFNRTDTQNIGNWLIADPVSK